jgi:hypothetical protein
VPGEDASGKLDASIRGATVTRILVGTQDGLRDVGDGSTMHDPLRGADVTALCHHDGGVWALVDEQELWRVEPGGSRAAKGASTGAPPGRCVASHAGAIWVGTAGARLVRYDGTRVEPVPTFDEAPTHEGWHTPWGGPADVWSMAADDECIYVNVHVGGILASADRGATWCSTIDLHDDVHEVAIGPDGTLWAATGERALAESHDRGAAWAFHGDPPGGTYARAAAPTDDGVVVAASSGPFSHDGVVSRFDGSSFSRCEGLPERFDGNIDARRLVARGATVALAGLDRRIYCSEDGGRTFAVVAEDLPEVRSLLLA